MAGEVWDIILDYKTENDASKNIDKVASRLEGAFDKLQNINVKNISQPFSNAADSRIIGLIGSSIQTGLSRGLKAPTIVRDRARGIADSFRASGFNQAASRAAARRLGTNAELERRIENFRKTTLGWRQLERPLEFRVGNSTPLPATLGQSQRVTIAGETIPTPELRFAPGSVKVPLELLRSAPGSVKVPARTADIEVKHTLGGKKEIRILEHEETVPGLFVNSQGEIINRPEFRKLSIKQFKDKQELMKQLQIKAEQEKIERELQRIEDEARRWEKR